MSSKSNTAAAPQGEKDFDALPAWAQNEILSLRSQVRKLQGAKWIPWEGPDEFDKPRPLQDQDLPDHEVVATHRTGRRALNLAPDRGTERLLDVLRLRIDSMEEHHRERFLICDERFSADSRLNPSDKGFVSALNSVYVTEPDKAVDAFEKIKNEVSTKVWEKFQSIERKWLEGEGITKAETRWMKGILRQMEREAQKADCSGRLD